jgi:lipopolysaccharide biosynthesis glycosyltransferase
MSKTEFFKNDYATVFQQDGDTTVLQYFKKVPDHETFLAVNEAIIDGYKKKPTQILVADVRNMGILSVDAQKWVSNTLIPTLIELLNGKTLYHAQFLNPNEVLSRLSANNVKRFSEALTSNFVLMQFGTQEELDQGIAEYRKYIEASK